MKNKINRFLISIINILVLLTSGTVWQVQNNILTLILCICICIFIVFNANKLIFRIINYRFTILPLSIYMIIGTYIYDSNYNKLIIIFLILLLFLILCDKSELNYIVMNLSKIIVIYSFINLIIYIMLQFNIVNYNSQIFLNSYERSINKVYFTYNNLFYNWQGNFDLFGISIIRNSGIFVEAGRYGVILSIALTIQILISKKMSKVSIAILLLSIISTVSTTTILVSIFIIVLRYYNKINMGKNKVLNITVFVIVSITGLIGGILVFQDKLKSVNGKASLFLRTYDMKIAIEYFKEKMLFGWGIGNDDIIKSSIYYGTSVDGNANGITKLLYQGGIFVTLIYIVFFIIFMMYVVKLKGKIRGIGITCILLFQIASQSLIYDTITIFLLLYTCISYFSKESNEKFIIYAKE